MRHAGAPRVDDPAALEPHDAVGSRGKLGTVRDQQHGAPGAQPLDRLADELGVDRVEVRGRLVEDHERRVAQERARERDPLPLAGRQAPPALADDRAVPVRQPGDERVGAGLLGGGTHAVVGRRGVAEPDVVGDGAAKQRRILRHPGDVCAPGRRVARGQVDPTDRHAPARRLAEAEQERGGGALAAAALADERDRLARLELEVDGLEHGDLPGRIGEGDALEPDRRAARARRMPGPGRDRRRLLDQAEQPLGDGEPVGARVVPGGEIPQRQVELRREHEHRQRGLEPDVAVDEAHAHRDRDERDAERRGELEHRPGEERDPERPHRGPPVVVAHLLDPLGLRLASVEGAQRRQAAHDVEEVRREQRQRLPALPRVPGRGAADQPHEDRDERQREQHDPGRERVDRGDEHEHGDRDDGCEEDLRQVTGERGLERVDAVHRGRRDLGALGAVERGRVVAQPGLDEVEPQLREDAGRRAPPPGLEAPGCAGARHDHDDEQLERQRHVRERRPVERPCRDPSEQYRLCEDEQRRGEAERGVDPEEQPRRPCATEQARVEETHASEPSP